MERGSVIITSVAGDHGKPRPAVVIQNGFLTGPGTVAVCLMTSEIDVVSDSRLVVQPTPTNGLRKTSVVMIEKIYPVDRIKAQPPIGRLADDVMDQLDSRLAFVLGLTG